MGNNIKMDLIVICDMVWIGFRSQIPGCCEHDNEPSGSVNGGQILEQLNDCYIYKKKLYSSEFA
jgi:hypothetical protein